MIAKGSCSQSISRRTLLIYYDGYSLHLQRYCREEH